MNDDKASIQFNGKEVQNPAARKALGTVLVAVFIILFLACIVMLVVLPYVLMIGFIVTLGIVMVGAVIMMIAQAVARPFDWVLKKLGRVGIIRKGDGHTLLILDSNTFKKAPRKAAGTERGATQE